MTLTQEQLKEELDYNQDTGDFIRLKSRGNQTANTVINAKATPTGYIEIRVFNGRSGQSKKYKAHRLAWLYVTGKFPELDIDHIDGNRSNNKFCNLREVSRQLNSRNREIGLNSPSGVLGVTWDKKRFFWQVTFNSKYQGKFDSFWEAVALRKKLEAENGTYERNHSSTERINFIED